jgi:hypothetical protein
VGIVAVGGSLWMMMEGGLGSEARRLWRARCRLLQWEVGQRPGSGDKGWRLGAGVAWHSTQQGTTTPVEEDGRATPALSHGLLPQNAFAAYGVELGDSRCEAWLNTEQSRAVTPGLGWTSGEGAVGVDDRGNECGGVSSVRQW